MQYLRRVIRICAEDSPNVKRGIAQRAAGLVADGLDVIRGPLSLAKYDYRRKTWDKIRQSVGLDAQFYKGAEVLLWPPDWLALCVRQWLALGGARATRKAKAIGIDPAEGGDKTSMCAADEVGILEIVSKRTPNTALIRNEAIAFGRKWDVPPERWFFDRGGGGQQHVDTLRQEGFKCRSVAFGESPSLDPKRGTTMVEARLGIKEDRYVYLNRRAEMFHGLHLLCDPQANAVPYGLSTGTDAANELLRQLSLIPKQFRIPGTTDDWSMYDAEGRIRMLPKNKRNAGDKMPTLTDLLGCSPDEADSAVLAVWGVFAKSPIPVVQVA